MHSPGLAPPERVGARSVIDPALALYEELAQQNAEALFSERAFVDAFITERVGVGAHPVLQEQLTAAGGILEWQLFGEPGDPLPPGLVKVVNRDLHGMEVQLDPRYGQDFYGIMLAWGKAGLDNFWETRIQRRTADYEDLHPHLHALFASTPLGKRLCAFSEQPPVAAEERPLPDYLVAARLAPVKHHLAALYGIEYPHRVENHANARIPLRTAQARIELETTLFQRHAAGPDLAFDHARAYITGLIREHYKKEDPNLEVYGQPHLTTDYNQGMAVATNQGEKHLQLRKVLQPLISEMYGPTDYRIETFDDLAMNIAYAVFTGSSLPYDSFLDRMLRQSFQLSKHPAATSMVAEEPWWSRTLHAALKEPPDEAIPYTTYAGLLQQNDHLREETSGWSIDSLTGEQLSDKLNTKKGSIAVDKSYHGSATRIATTRPKDSSIGPYGPDATLTITEGEARYNATDPYIPGFHLVGRQAIAGSWAVEYKFEPASEGDPYVPCLVAVPDDGKAALADAYRTIGMTHLADLVENDAALTVESLRSYITEDIIYPYPTTETSSGGGNETLGIFRVFVENGKLATQCSGTALFIKCSIDTAFGHGYANVIQGRAVPMLTTDLTAVEHAQVAANLEGKLYLLDAFPSSSTFMPGMAPNAPERNLLTRAALYPTDAFRSHIASRQLASVIENGRRALEDELAHFFNARSPEHLHNTVAHLGEDDPIFRTMRHFHLARKHGRIDRPELEKTMWFLDVLINNEVPTATPKSRYTAGLLRLTRHELANLLAASTHSQQLI